MTASDGVRSVCRPPAPAGRHLHAPNQHLAILLGFTATLILWMTGLCWALGLFGTPFSGVVSTRLPIAVCAAGLVVTVLVAAVTLRPERDGRARGRRAEDVHSARNLQRLSSRLVEAIEKERRHVARELHDEIGQALTAIKMELAQAERSQTPEGVSAALQSARTATDAALHAVRDLSRMLHPRILDDLGLAAALEMQVRDFSRRTGIPAQLSHDAVEHRADARVALCAYRIVQEALTNVGRHAAATRCDVSLSHHPGTLRVIVQDDGRGFDPQAAAGDGVGLLGIQERVAGCGGRYSLETAPGRGTRLVVDLPLSPSEVTPEVRREVAGAV